jgi:pimeloyl-ACP methyl ester carboxylesterase
MTDFLEIAAGRVAYDVTGEGPLIVCVPGMGDIRQSYRFVAPKLVEAGYRVATMDLRGLGGSSTGWDSYQQSAVAGDIIALIKQLGGPATVIAQSYSPGAAIIAAAQAPDDVAGLVLIAPFTSAPKLNPVMSLMLTAIVRVPTLWGLFYTSLYPGAKPVDFADYLAALKKNLREPGRTAAVAAMCRADARNDEPYRAQVRCPAMVIMGSKDSDFPDPEAEAKRAASVLPQGAQVAMIDDAGHYPHAQFPDETNKALLAFLAKTVQV